MNLSELVSTLLYGPAVASVAELTADPINLGPLERGHYIQIGLGTGFYIPEADYQSAQTAADVAHRVQFVGVTRDGRAIHGSRDEILENPDSSGLIAWIVPSRAIAD